MLTQRIGKSANEFLTVEGYCRPKRCSCWVRTSTSSKEITEGLLRGNDLKLRRRHQGSAQTASRWKVSKLFDQTRGQASFILGTLQGLVASRDAQVAIIDDSEPCVRVWKVQKRLAEGAGVGGFTIVMILLFLATVAAGYGLLRVFLTDQTIAATSLNTPASGSGTSGA